jgi:hypothetical protein
LLLSSSYKNKSSKGDKTMDKESVVIKAPEFRHAEFEIYGVSPYVQLRMTEKAKNQMRDKMLEGQRAKKGKAREPRDFGPEFEAAMYKSTEGWYGINAAAFRNAMISACKIVGFQMTKAKLSVFVEPDGFDALDATPLVRIYGEPERYESITRNATGVPDIRTRAMWRKWSVKLLIRWDSDQFSLTDISNLLGMQVGIGEGRPDSKASAGLGFGLFGLKEG